MIRSVTAAAVVALTLSASAFAAPGPQPYDSPATTSGRAVGGLSILPTLPFAFGEVDFATLGVSDAELATVGPTAAAASSTSNLTVDDNLADCPNAGFTSIQAAVNAAPAGSKIKVCRGTYTEQVTIGAGKNGLTLFSEGKFQAVIKAPAVMVDVKAIVRVSGAQDVTIKHFLITGPGGFSCDSLRYGVRVDGGGSALITDNHITEIRDTPFLSGCQNGVGVLIGRNAEGQVASGTVTHNLIDRYQKGGVVVDGLAAGPASTAEVDHNEIVGVGPTANIAQNGIQISRGAVANVHHNEISQNNYTPTTTVSEGLLLFEGGANSSIDHNYSYLNNDGIGLYTTESIVVSHNKLRDNTYDGIFADSDTAENLISHNDAKDNGSFDCEDLSVGPYGPDLVANIWEKDKGDTQNRPGLCKK